jgi:cytochrome P450
MADGSLPILGHLLAFRRARKTTHDFFKSQVFKYGPIVRVTLPGFGIRDPVDGMMVTNLEDVEFVYRDVGLFEKGDIMRRNARDLIGDGIFLSDGEQWRQQRKTTAKVFNIGAFREYYSPIFEDTSMKVIGHLEACAKQNAFVELQDLLGRATLESFGQTANGQVYGALKGTAVIEKGQYTLPVSHYAEAFDGINRNVAKRTGNPFWEWTEWITGTSKDVAKNVKILRDFALGTILTKRKLNEAKESHRKDLLDHFLEVRDEQGQGLSDDELVDHVRNFLTAGRDSVRFGKGRG